MTEPVFTDWSARATESWGRRPMRLAHSLHRHPLFSMEALAELIEGYPADEHDLVQMGAPGESKRFWRHGAIGRMSGAQVIEWIAAGRLWLNLRRLHHVRPAYRGLLERAFDEIAARVPGLKLFNPTIGLLISSPQAQVYYHADLPGQMLWQIEGRKRVYVYPTDAPFLDVRRLEDVVALGLEEDMPYDPEFDRHAQVFDLEPGQMLTWPLNAPHRVENLGVLNVSMTAEYWTDGIERSHRVNMANGLLRNRFGLPVTGRALSGPSYWAKAALQGALRRSSWTKKVHAARKVVSFELDPARRGAIRDLAPAAEPVGLAA